MKSGVPRVKVPWLSSAIDTWRSPPVPTSTWIRPPAELVRVPLPARFARRLPVTDVSVNVPPFVAAAFMVNVALDPAPPTTRTVAPVSVVSVPLIVSDWCAVS